MDADTLNPHTTGVHALRAIKTTVQLNRSQGRRPPTANDKFAGIPWSLLEMLDVSSDISVLKFISVLVSISFSVNHFYFYIISVLPETIISVLSNFD